MEILKPNHLLSLRTTKSTRCRWMTERNLRILFRRSRVRSVGAEVASPWFYLQFGLILAGAGIAYAAGAAIRSRIDMDTLAMGWPAPFRHFVRVLVANASTAVFAIVMIIVRVVMWHSTWPSRSYLLAVAAKLALAWLMIRLITSVIRNDFIVRLVSLSAWMIAASSILGQLDPTIDTLNSVSIVLGGLRLTPLLLIKLGVLLVVALWLTNIAQQFRREPDHPVDRPDAVDPGAAGQDGPGRPDDPRRRRRR